MRRSVQLLLGGAAGLAVMIGVPLTAGAQTPTPITFTLTVAGPYIAGDAFDVHVDLPLANQAQTLCVAPGTAGSTAPACASGRTFTAVYQAYEWPNVPYWYERTHGGTVVQTFAHGSIPAAPARTVPATYTYAGAAVAVPATGAFEASGLGAGLALVALGLLAVGGSLWPSAGRRSDRRRAGRDVR